MLNSNIYDNNYWNLIGQNGAYNVNIGIHQVRVKQLENIQSVRSIFLIGVCAVLGSISHNATQCNGEY